MGQRVTDTSEYSREAKTRAEQILDQDVRDQRGIAELVGGGQEEVIIPQLGVYDDSRTTEMYNEFRNRVTGNNGGNPEALGHEFGEAMNSLEWRLGNYGDTSDFDVQVSFDDGVEERSFQTRWGSHGRLQDFMGEVFRYAEKEHGNGEDSDLYEMARSIDDEIPSIEGL